MSTEGKGLTVFAVVAIKAVVLMGHCSDGARLVKAHRSTQVISSSDDLFRTGNQLKNIDEVTPLHDTHIDLTMIDTVDLTLDIIELQEDNDNK